jgi:hypothetical protein
MKPKSKKKNIFELRRKQSKFIGHILRKGRLEHVVTTGKMMDNRDRERQREKILDSLAEWYGKKQQQT